jgi:hypothetical protein
VADQHEPGQSGGIGILEDGIDTRVDGDPGADQRPPTPAG